MSKRIIFEDRIPDRIRFVGGVDVAYSKDVSVSAAAVLDFDSLKIVESKVAVCRTVFPYFPTLLSFREIHPSISAIRMLDVQPDVFIVGAHGYAHPYRCGFASHLGLAIRMPTIGVAKEVLIGLNVSQDKKNHVFLVDKGEVIGAQVATKVGTAPVYVSVGHMISLNTAIAIVRHCTIRGRLPEPILAAHSVATAEKRKINISGEMDR